MRYLLSLIPGVDLLKTKNFKKVQIISVPGGPNISAKLSGGPSNSIYLDQGKLNMGSSFLATDSRKLPVQYIVSHGQAAIF